MNAFWRSSSGASDSIAKNGAKQARQVHLEIQLHLTRRLRYQANGFDCASPSVS